MKTALSSSRNQSNSNNGKLGVVSAILVALLGVAVGAHMAIASSNEKIPTVHISAKRMTVDEKIAYDTAGQIIPTVVLTATRLSTEQKLAMDTARPGTRPGLLRQLAKGRQHG
ncbi:hypothetical protein [Undibacterium sp. Ren11W]|uniref:hypothetical protein n=1 Tax=Undibacterium sp. Ren11W TaxID=3413045 RepID=UPI003BF0EA1B